MADFSLSFRRIEDVLRTLTAYILMALLILGSIVSIPSPFPGIIKPFLVLMPIYYWSIYRPTLVPPFMCFMIGMLMDALSGGPLGLSAFILVAVQWLIRRQRRFLMGQPYITIWAVFAVTNVGSLGVQYMLLRFVQGEWTPPLSIFLSMTAGIFLFPFITLLLLANHRLLPVSRRARN